MGKSKKTGKTPAVENVDIVTAVDEVLAYPEQPQEIPEPEKTQPVNGEVKPFLGVFAEEPHPKAGSTEAPAGWFATEDTPDLEADEERIPRAGSLAADLDIGVIGEQPEEPDVGDGYEFCLLHDATEAIVWNKSIGWYQWKETIYFRFVADMNHYRFRRPIASEPSFHGDLPPEELPWPELNNEAGANFVLASDVKPKFDLDENLYPVVVSQEAVRADIEAEHAGITLQDTDILADADGCKPGDFVVDPLWTDTPNLQPSEPEPNRPSPRGSDYVPPVGSWWSMPTAEPYALTVVESPNDGLVRCRDYVKRDGLVSTGVTKIALEDFRVGLLILELCCPAWVLTGRELSKAPLVPDRFPVKMEAEPSEENGAAEVANELGVEVRDVQLIVDSALHAVASVFSLKSIASCSPVFDSALRLLASDGAAALIVRLLREVSPKVFREAFLEAARTYMIEYEQDQKYLKSNLQEHRESIDGELSGIRSAVTTLDENIVRHIKSVVARIEKLERNQSEVNLENACAGGVAENKVFEMLQSELNPIREDMASLQDRQDLVERKRLMADDQKRKNQKAHHNSMKKPKAEQLENRRARDKTARELKTVEAEKVGEIKRGRGRPRKVDAPSKSTAKPAAKPPKVTAKLIVVPVDLVAGMMKKSPDKKIEKLLRGLDPKQLKRISDQFPKGLPDVTKIPGWVEADRFAFVRWYFGQSGN